MYKFIFVLMLVLFFCSCETIRVTGNTQTELLSKQSVQLEQLKDNNEKMSVLIESLNDDVKDLKEWGKVTRRIYEEMRFIIDSNKHILQ